ncbi:hypothetical protein [Fodinicola feengrottensis]|uniref:hypothetical protein n=1 Tax=Fodinicola feengrottensis TaxID=435914 RepID=UPI0013D6B2FB|nr:hypothetical protein [Fodinicola feengrottensis]
MTREQLDRALKAQTDENARLAGALLEMDTHPGHQLLKDAVLTGVTLTRWTQAKQDMSVLWAQFSVHRRLVEQAQQVRDRRSRPTPAEVGELRALLTGPVVELDAERMPIDRRGATVPAAVTDRISLPVLLERMIATYRQITQLLTAVDTAWFRIAAQLDPLESQLLASGKLAVSLNANRNRVERIATELTSVREAVLADPLGTSFDELTRLAGDLAAVRAELQELAAVRDSFQARLDQLASRLADLATAQQVAAQTAALVREKIADPGLSPLPDQATALAERLDDLRASGHTGRGSSSWLARPRSWRRTCKPQPWPYALVRMRTTDLWTAGPNCAAGSTRTRPRPGRSATPRTWTSPHCIEPLTTCCSRRPVTWRRPPWRSTATGRRSPSGPALPRC